MEESIKGLLMGAALSAFLMAVVLLAGIISECMQTQEAACRRYRSQPNIVIVSQEAGDLDRWMIF